MISLIARLTPLAAGVALSPLLVLAVLVILLSKRALPGSIALTASWIVGLAVAIGISIAFAETIQEPRLGPDLQSEGFFTLAVGVGLVVMAALSRRGRRLSPHGDEPPAWVNSVDRLSPAGASVFAFLHATTSPKNLALAIAAGRAVVDAKLPTAESAAAVVYYLAIASLTAVVPVTLYLLGGARATVVLEGWRRRVTANASAVMEVMLFLVGLFMSAKGLYNLLS